jgi:hypothetical protein
MSVKLRHGKHKGKSVESLFFSDPGYVYWMVKKGIHEDAKWFSFDEQARFQTLLRRASHLRIPGLCPWCGLRPVSRMFMTIHASGGLATVSFDCSVCEPSGSSFSTPMKPSFYTPDIFRSYDKTGGKVLVQAIKRAYFGNKSHRMTDQRLSEFWDNKDNFVDF